MSLRTILMIGIALVAAAGTALFARGWLNAERAAMANGPAKAAHYVLVAKTDFPAGHFVKGPELRWQGWPKSTMAQAYVLKGTRKPEDFEGAVVRHAVTAGQPITDAMMVRPGEQGFLAAVLEPGMRAVSIQVNAISGISGFIFPGDRVDLLLTHTVRDPSGRGSRLVSETALQNIRVLAVDQKTDDQKNKAKASVAKTVTFEVTPKQAEKISILGRLGRLSLSLRSLAREEEEAIAGTDNPAKTKDSEGSGDAPVSIPVGEADMTEQDGEGGIGARLSPIASARAEDGAPASLLPENRHPEDNLEIPPDGVDAEGGPRADGDGDGAGTASGSGEPADVAAGQSTPVPPNERAGVTLDSEVSRVIHHSRNGSGHVLRVVRGNKAQDHRF